MARLSNNSTGKIDAINAIQFKITIKTKEISEIGTVNNDIITDAAIKKQSIKYNINFD